MIRRETWDWEARTFQASDLKICDLCGALNLATNTECFVCRWRGHFDCRAEVVTLAMELLERRHGRIDLPLVTDEIALSKFERPTLRDRLALFFGWLRHWFFGKDEYRPRRGVWRRNS